MTPIVEVRDLTRRFGAFTAVDGVSFEVGRGEIFGYLRANGAGKSTTIRMLCGLLAPTSGEARVAGHDVAHHPASVKQSLGYMSQRFSLYVDLTVEENLAFFAGAYGLSGARRREAVAGALALAGLTDRRAALTRDLPGGIRQRLALASALLHGPPIVFLDEPTAGVDPGARREFWQVIRGLARGGMAALLPHRATRPDDEPDRVTVFVTTHHLDEAEYCDRVGLMVDGRLAALDTPAGLKRTWVPGTVQAFGGTPGAAEVSAALSGVPGVHAVQPFGDRVHVRAEGVDAAAVLRDRGLSFTSVEPADATLEDVFLEVVRR